MRTLFRLAPDGQEPSQEALELIGGYFNDHGIESEVVAERFWLITKFAGIKFQITQPESGESLPDGLQTGDVIYNDWCIPIDSTVQPERLMSFQNGVLQITDNPQLTETSVSSSAAAAGGGGGGGGGVALGRSEGGPSDPGTPAAGFDASFWMKALAYAAFSAAALFIVAGTVGAAPLGLVASSATACLWSGVGVGIFGCAVGASALVVDHMTPSL